MAGLVHRDCPGILFEIYPQNSRECGHLRSVPVSRKRYALVGVSNRAIYMFLDKIREIYHNKAEIVAILDKDRSRMNWYNEQRNQNIPCFLPDQFNEMVQQTKPDVIIVACQDGMHHHYVIEALKLDLDVIVEKPLTIDEEKCTALAKAAAKSKGNVQVTFNYRYTPMATKIRELVAQGKVGKVVSVDLNWYLDTYHGATYFQRWNRLREVSGSLTVHKACHHFDLVHWWIGQQAVELFAYGTRNFYGPDGPDNPLTPEQVGDGRTCPTCDARQKCKYYMRWNREEFRREKKVRVDEHVDPEQVYENYSMRQCIFDPQINIGDTYSVTAKYDGGAFLSYSLTGSVPYEGFRLGINGTKGRIEHTEYHAVNRTPFPHPGEFPIIYIPMFGGREQIDVVNLGGGHGGGDPLLLDELFLGPDHMAPVDRAASLQEGIEAVLTGVAVDQSAQTNKIVSVEQMRKRVFEGS